MQPRTRQPVAPARITVPLANYPRDKLERLVAQWYEYMELQAAQAEQPTSWIGETSGLVCDRDYHLVSMADFYLRNTRAK